MANYGTVERVEDGPQSGWLKIHIEGYDAAAAGSFGNIANPEGCLLQITDGYLRVVDDADAAATLDIGIGAADADETDICSAYDINGASANDVIYLVGKDAASEAAATTPKGVLWAATDYMTFYNPQAANPVNFEGYAYFRYIRFDD